MPTDAPKPTEGLVIVPLGGKRPAPVPSSGRPAPSGGPPDAARVGTEQMTPRDDGPKSSGNGRMRITR